MKNKEEHKEKKKKSGSQSRGIIVEIFVAAQYYKAEKKNLTHNEGSHDRKTKTGMIIIDFWSGNPHCISKFKYQQGL
jgi:hypothetical protein